MAHKIFQIVEKEFFIVTKLFMDAGNAAGAANTYYQIGQLSEFVFHNPAAARAYYQRAAQLDPSNPTVKAAVGRL